MSAIPPDVSELMEKAFAEDRAIYEAAGIRDVRCGWPRCGDTIEWWVERRITNRAGLRFCSEVCRRRYNDAWNARQLSP